MSTTSQPGSRVAAIVVNYKALDHLLRCLQSLRAESVEEIIVVDNDSRDNAERAVAAADPDVVFIQTGANLGMGTGTNRGAAASVAELVLAVNPDVEVEPGAVKALVAALDSDPRIGIVGPRIDEPDGSLYPSARTFPSTVDAIGHAFIGLVRPDNPFTRRYRMLDWDHERASDVDWVSGACFIARREMWNDIRGFDESYFMYAEDVDLCWRAHRAGWKVVYEPSARVIHAQGISTDQHPYRMILEHHRALLRFAARSSKGIERALLPLVALGLTVRTPLAWLHRARRGRGRPDRAPEVK